jgi:hypothetical protein
MRIFFKILWLIWPVFLVSFLSACGPEEPDLGSETLIRVGDRTMTVFDFNTAFEIAKTAHDYNIREQSEDLRKAKLRLLNQLTVEMVLLERAEDLGISVTDAELEKAVDEIKSDYPKGEFEATLLEFAVSYDSWKKRLKTRLIMEKVIDEELKSKVTITAEDISEFYKKNYRNREPETGSTQPSEDINEAIVERLRRKKTEETYNSWIEELKGKYEIDINNQLWEKISGSKSTNEIETNIESSEKSE